MRVSKSAGVIPTVVLIATLGSQMQAAEFTPAGKAATSSLPAALGALNLTADNVLSEQSASEVRGQGGCCAPPPSLPPWLYCYRPKLSLPSYPGPQGPPAPPPPPGPPRSPVAPCYSPVPHGSWGPMAGAPKCGWGGGHPSFGAGCFK
jgi:hypothetical protein